jgi:hypothetical protein
MACLKSEKIIMILVKEVTIKISVGANTRSVKIIAVLMVLTNCAGSFIPATERFTIGAVSGAAKAKIENINSVIINFKKNPVQKLMDNS